MSEVTFTIPTLKGEKWATPLPGYYISNKGRIYSTKQTRFLSGNFNGAYRVLVGFDGHGNKKIINVAKFVAQEFLPPPAKSVKSPVLDHKDGDRGNCEANNLFWRNSLRPAKLTPEAVREIRKGYKKAKDEWGYSANMARKYGVSRQLIYNVVKDRAWLGV